MLDPIVNFFTLVFQWIGRGIGFVIGIILWPFMWVGRWYTQRGWILKAVLGAALLLLVGLYGYFVWNTQAWTNFNPDYVANYTFDNVSAGEQTSAENAAARTCARSAIADVAADLTDFNVNQNAWISSMILYKLGLFGLDWDKTPFLDNKASFQRGVHEAVRRTTTELADNLGRVRTTSQIDSNLQSARGNAQFDEFTWYFGLSPFGPKTPTPSYYRAIVTDLQDVQRQAWALRRRIRRPRRQSHPVSRPHIQRRSATPRRSSGSARKTTTTAGSTPGPTTASGSPMDSSTPITACSRAPRRTSRESCRRGISIPSGTRWNSRSALPCASSR